MSQILSAGSKYLVGAADRGRAALYDGAQALLMHHTPQAAYQPILDNGTFTFEAWVFPTRIGAGYSVRQDLWNTSDGSNVLYFWLAEYANWRPEFFWNNSQGQSFVAGPALHPQRWAHLAVTYARDAPPNNLKMYVNGSLYASATGQGNPPLKIQAANGLIDPLGRGNIGFLEGDGARRFGGQFDEFRIWNIARTAQDIADGVSQSVYYNNLTNRTGLAFSLGCETIVPTPTNVQGNHSANALEDTSGFGGHAFTQQNSQLPARIGSLAPLPYKVVGLLSV